MSAERLPLKPQVYPEIDLGFWNTLLHPRDAHGRFISEGGPGPAERAANEAYNPNAMESFRMLVGNGKTMAEAEYHKQMQHLAETHGKFATDEEAHAAIDKAHTILQLTTQKVKRNGGRSDPSTARLVAQAQGLLDKAAVTLYHEHRAQIEEPKKGVEKAVDIAKDAAMTTLKEHSIGVVGSVAALSGTLLGSQAGDQIHELAKHFLEMSVGDALLAATLAAILGFLGALIRKGYSKAVRKARRETPRVKPKETPLAEYKGLGIAPTEKVSLR